MPDVQIGEIRVGILGKIQATRLHPQSRIVEYMNVEGEGYGSMPERAWLALPYWKGDSGHIPDEDGRLPGRVRE